jgi:serine/threonine-protein kinase
VGSVLGTAAYLSPEQASGEESTPASDIYSLGVCAYQFLSGRLPHEYGSLTELALKQQSDAVQPIRNFRPEVPAELDRAIRLCLERDPRARYASALDLAGAAEAGLHGEETDATQLLERTQAMGYDPDATRAMLGGTEDTRAIPRTQRIPPRTTVASPPQRRAPAREDRRPSPARARARRWIAVLAVLVAAVVAVLILTQTGGGSNKGPVNSGDVHGQIDGLKQLIQDNTQ